MDFTVKENIPGLMLFIDFQKAFDSVEWEFLFKCLEAFNFGPDFLHWVKVFYKNIQSCILNNGMTSSFFTLERRVRQGDPLSPHLFVVAVETPAIAIRQNSDIKGFYTEEQETKLFTVYTLFTNGRQPGTSAQPNMESRRFGIKQVKLCL